MDAGKLSDDFETEVVPGRLAALADRRRGFGKVVYYTVYLKTAEGPSIANAEIMASLLEHARGHGLPWHAMGDFNMEPGEVEQMLHGADRQVFISADPDEGTCRRHDGTFATLDYALSDARARYLVTEVKTRLDVAMAPHRPVVCTFNLDCSREVEVVAKCPRLPAERVFGPTPEAPDWTELARKFQGADGALTRVWG